MPPRIVPFSNILLLYFVQSAQSVQKAHTQGETSVQNDKTWAHLWPRVVSNFSRLQCLVNDVTVVIVFCGVDDAKTAFGDPRHVPQCAELDNLYVRLKTNSSQCTPQRYCKPRSNDRFGHLTLGLFILLKELFSNVDARCILDFTKENGFYQAI